MIERHMYVEAEPSPQLCFDPPQGADFKPVRVDIPVLIGHQIEYAFRQDVKSEIVRACGAISCSGDIYTVIVGKAHSDEERIVVGAKIQCGSEECPLRGPGESGDREPRQSPPLAPKSAWMQQIVKLAHKQTSGAKRK